MMRSTTDGNGGTRRGSGGRRSKGGARVASMFRVFSDQTRLRILRLLEDGPLCVADLVALLRAPQPTVSRHLAYLRRSGFVATQQHGLWIFYEPAPAGNALHGKLLECLRLGADLLPGIEEDLVRARNLRRAGGCCPEGRRLMEAFQRRKIDEE